MELFYTPPETVNLASKQIILSGQEVRHIAKVLRKKVGDELHCTDGVGSLLHTVIEEIDGNKLLAKIMETRFEPEPETQVTVAISLMKAADRFEFFLEKATELGITEIIPMITERTVSRPSEKQHEAKHERWSKIVHSACKQSQRLRFPTLHQITPYKKVLERDDDLKLIPYELSEEQPKVSFAGKRVLFLIGGEGGFSEKEVIAAKSAGFREMTIGSTILRAETAGIFVVGMVRAETLLC
ncbi:MAG: 16S rRNA (uracil(1498)-N(3))-methyltransferase [Chlorobiales bacterium]|nr:16S rRNA (uracil(1498)-N(3))-methyltransferase [Chlorobiales bacterium]